MNRLLAIGALLLCLTACAMQPTHDASHASDLDALLSTVKSDTTPRVLPNGRTYCVELAATNDARDACAGDLEDGFYLSEQDKSRAYVDVYRAVQRLKLERDPCGWMATVTRRPRCRITDPPPVDKVSSDER